MTEIELPDGHTLTIETESIEVTRGAHGMPNEPTRRFAPGVTSYYLDGRSISAEEAQAIVDRITADPANI